MKALQHMLLNIEIICCFWNKIPSYLNIIESQGFNYRVSIWNLKKKNAYSVPSTVLRILYANNYYTHNKCTCQRLFSLLLHFCPPRTGGGQKTMLWSLFPHSTMWVQGYNWLVTSQLIQLSWLNREGLSDISKITQITPYEFILDSVK